MEIIVDKKKWKEKIKLSCIYRLTNNINGKVYIGQTRDFRKRMSDYKNIIKRERQSSAIGQAFTKYGHENFTADILEECKPSKLNERELYYITKYDACNPECGYNNSYMTNNSSDESCKRKSLAHTGLKESSLTKRKKSNIIIAVSIWGDDYIECESAKLFGDYLGKTKDQIKNYLRTPSESDGYRFYYYDYEKRQEIRKKVESKSRLTYDDKQYLKILDFLDYCELNDSVETIYVKYTAKRLDYDHVDKDGVPYPYQFAFGYEIEPEHEDDETFTDGMNYLDYSDDPYYYENCWND